MQAAGDVADFTETVVAVLRQQFVRLAGTSVDKVELTVTAASVLFIVTIHCDDAAGASAVVGRLSSQLSTQAAASSALSSLGITVTSAPQIAVGVPPDEGGISTVLLVVLVLVFLFVTASLFVASKVFCVSSDTTPRMTTHVKMQEHQINVDRPPTVSKRLGLQQDRSSQVKGRGSLTNLANEWNNKL